jgi:hypothetical protein
MPHQENRNHTIALGQEDLIARLMIAGYGYQITKYRRLEGPNIKKLL